MSEIMVKGRHAGRRAAEASMEGGHELRILDKSGDTRLIWDPENEQEVAQARKTFDDLRAQRFIAYSVGEGGSKGQQITSFDPAVEKMILAPPMAGGEQGEIDVLIGGRELLRTDGFHPGQYMPEGVEEDPETRGGYCAIGAMIAAAGGGEQDCHANVSAAAPTVGETKRITFLINNPHVFEAHDRLSAALDMSLTELVEAAVAKAQKQTGLYDEKYADEVRERLQELYHVSYGRSKVELFAEHVADTTSMIALYTRAIEEAQAEDLLIEVEREANAQQRRVIQEGVVGVD